MDYLITKANYNQLVSTNDSIVVKYDRNYYIM